MSDVVVIGGGVIGLTLAWDLAGQGARVTVLERGQFGREASWAGAGILPPGNPDAAVDPYSRLRAESARRWPGLSAELKETTGIDNGYRQCGGLCVATGQGADLTDDIDFWQAECVAVEPLSRDGLLAAEPSLGTRVASGYRLPQMAQVRNPRHLKALVAACAARGVELRSATSVVGFDVQSDRAIAARTDDGLVEADRFCIAGGAWSSGLLDTVGCELPIVPVRGQIVLLSVNRLPFRHVIECGPRYLVPRPDGRILIGSTEEWVGFDKRNTAGAVSGLIDFAVSLVPELADATVERTWAGLRPGSPQGMPYLGGVPAFENLYVAAGHFRAGLQLSPGTAGAMCALILGNEPAIPLDAFAVVGRGFRRAADGMALLEPT